LLQGNGYRLLTATNGHDDQRLFMSRSVDAIVLEYHLGLLDGAFIAAEIKQVENCENGWDECDRSKLSPLEASQSAFAEHQRSISACGGRRGNL
jgi:CheY-like chemotaxis protein